MPLFHAIQTLFLLFCLMLLSACDGGIDDAALRDQIKALGLNGDPSKGRNLPSISEPKAQLGKRLFFSKALSGNLDTACASCHHPLLGGGDGLALSIGVDALDPDLIGPGRLHRNDAVHYDGGPTIPRNTPTTFNLGLWDSVLFHDGRLQRLDNIDGVEQAGQGGIMTPDSAFGEADKAAGSNLVSAQATFPLSSFEEMRGFDAPPKDITAQYRARLQQRLGGYGRGGGELGVNAWLAAFRDGFEQPSASARELVTFANLIEALGDYQRSQVFINSPWRAWLWGDDDALSESAKRGAKLFFSSKTEGGADCYRCHRGDKFSDEQFHVLAIPQIGRGKGDGPNGNDDFGRMRVSGQAHDRYAFRTPSLLNVAVTGPWGHSGAYTALEGVVRHHLNPAAAVTRYDFNRLENSIQTSHARRNTQAALAQLAELRALGKPVIEPLALNDQSLQDLLHFLQSLTDLCVKQRQCLEPWLPDASVSILDPLVLQARDQSGRLY